MSSSLIFWSIIISSQVCGLAAYILLQVWLQINNGGFDWNSDSSRLIQNYHALFMTLGFLLLFGEATLTYRILARTNVSYLLQKFVHATILVTATIIWMIGLAASFKARNLGKAQGKDINHFYSFHSWLGFLLMLIFVCQLCFAIMWHINFQRIKPALQALYQSIHTFNGVFLFVLSTVTCFTGLNELAVYKVKNYSQTSSSGIHLNFVGMALFGFAVMIGYLLWKPEFKLTPPVGETGRLSHSEHTNDENLHPIKTSL